MKTLFHNLLFPDNLELPLDNYYFCASKTCNAGYFSQSITIPKQKLKVFHELQQGWLCYCFNISEADYKTAFESKNFEPIKNFVVQKTKTGDCACEIKNPSGQCCLAKFKQLEKHYD
ncbi:MAG: hypothetical protein GQ569_05500 [Methylococcaceae bacterium]|nr:hypothetical protein [Methylococcaceae bacterium]